MAITYVCFHNIFKWFLDTLQIKIYNLLKLNTKDNHQLIYGTQHIPITKFAHILSLIFSAWNQLHAYALDAKNLGGEGYGA